MTLDAPHGAIDAFDDLIDAPRAAIHALDDLIDAAHATIDAFDDLINAPRATIHAFDDLINASRAAIDAFDDLIDAPRAAIDAFDDLINAPRATIDALGDAIDALGDATDCFEDVIDAPRASIAGSAPISRSQAHRQPMDFRALSLARRKIDRGHALLTAKVPASRPLRAGRTRRRMVLHRRRGHVRSTNRSFQQPTIHPPFIKRRVITMNTTNSSNRIVQQASDQKLSQGLAKHSAAISSLFISGSSVPTSQIVATLQSLANSSQAAETAAAAWHAAVEANREARAKARPLLLGVRRALQVMFAGSPEALADFGLSARKPRVLTPEVKVAAAAKAKATRAQRHTMGKVQKKAVKGAVTGVVVTPVNSAPAAATPPPTTTPAPAGASTQVANPPR